MISRTRTQTSQGRAASTVKTAAAVVLLGAAAVFGLRQCAGMNPPLKPAAPSAVQAEQAYAAAIESNLSRRIDSLNLAQDQRTKLERWMKWKPKDPNSKEERQGHTDALANILTPEQKEEFQSAYKEYWEQKRDLNEERQQRVKTMLGDRDYEKNRQDMKKIRQQRQERRPKPTITPTPAGQTAPHQPGTDPP